MSSVNHYDVGTIALDLSKRPSDGTSPFVYYTHELPLLSFGDAQHTLHLSLVFNYERYRTEKESNQSPFFIAPGYKLNLQKRLILDSTGKPTTYQTDMGQAVSLTQCAEQVFTFGDDSQSILRCAAQGYTVEHPDFGTEHYNASASLVSVCDRYSTDAVMQYTYDAAGRLTAITLGGTKMITLDYVSGRLAYIRYSNKSTELCYGTDGALHTVKHYTGVDYRLQVLPTDFGLSTVDFDYKVTALENETTALYSKELRAGEDHTTIRLIDTNASHIVHTVSYKTARSFADYTPPFAYVDITDNNGVATRVQFDNDEAFCSYELTDGAPAFYGNTPLSQFSGNVMLHKAEEDEEHNRAGGVQTQKDGMLMNYNQTSYEWSRRILDTGEKVGYYVVSGWVRSTVDNITYDTLMMGSDSTYPLRFDVDLYPDGQWKYISFMLHLSANTVYVKANMANQVQLRDMRVTFQETGKLTDGYESHTNMSDSVLLSGDTEISFRKLPFYYTVNGSDIAIVSDGENERKVTFSDIVRYKLQKKRAGICDEVYYNNSKQLIKGTTDCKILYNGSLISIDSLDVGLRVYANGKKSLTRLAIDEAHPNTAIERTYIVDGTSILTEQLDINLDLTRSTKDGVSTVYTRNAKGQLTSERVEGMYRWNITYTDTLTTVQELDPDTGTVLSATSYHIDPVWGDVYKIDMPDGSVTTDTYHEDMSALLYKSFDTAAQRRHAFAYAQGRPATMTADTLHYAFGYTSDTGDLASVTKGGSPVQQYTYTRSNGQTTVTTAHPSSQTLTYDIYGRLASVSGILENLYDLDPCWYYIYNTQLQQNELYHSLKNADGKDALLAKTTDLLAGEVIKYGYSYGFLSAAATYTAADVLKRQETFACDAAGRLTSDRFDYNVSEGDYVSSDITYVTAAGDPSVDNRVHTYVYSVNGAQLARTQNAYDTYDRMMNKTYRIQGKLFTKGITYDKTHIRQTTENYGGTTVYQYDNMHRIASIDNGSPVSFVYDTYGQLVRENNGPLDKTFVYEYNSIGNITSVKTYDYTTGALGELTSEQSFTYASTSPDQLISTTGTSVSYNTAGFPTTYRGFTATWTNGKLTRLRQGSMLSGTETYSYAYNAFGQRTSRSYSLLVPTTGSTTVIKGQLLSYNQSFCYDQSGRLVYESRTCTYYGESSSFDTLVYLYDENTVVGMVYTYDGVSNTYYLRRNLLGDVIALYDTSGTRVAEYAYDAWGNCKVVYSTKSIATRNPIRYRGYYYDQDTALYLLGARYYCPAWRRFISPDDASYLDPENTNGLNLYCYCNNDPVNLVDPSGNEPLPNWAKWLIGGVAFAGAVILTVISGGSLAPLFIGMGINIASSALLEGAISAHNGNDFWNGFTDGAADGAMWGGIFALASAGINAIKFTKGFRVVGLDEYDDVMRTGKFASNRSADGKYFWKSKSSSKIFASKMYPSSNYKIVGTRFSRFGLKNATKKGAAYSWTHLDGIGKAFYIEIETIEKLVFRIWSAL